MIKFFSGLSCLCCFILFSCKDNVVTPSLLVRDISIQENNDTQTINVVVSLSETSERDVKFHFSTMANTATKGKDYLDKQGDITIAAGSKTASFSLQVLGDTFVETEESFWISYTQPNGLNIPTPYSTVKITNDDADAISFVDGYNTPKVRKGYSLVWADEFDGSSLNLNNWGFDIGNSGWGNNELEYYQDGNKNVTVANGTLTITAKKEKVQSANYTSARIKTQGKKSFTFGRIDIRAKLMTGQGYWPALWMLGESISSMGWPACGEIDIMELVGSKPNVVVGTAHWGLPGNGSTYISKNYTLNGTDFSNEYHVFSIVWVKDQIQWYVDDQLYHTITKNNVNANVNYPFNSPHFFIFNVAVGGNWPGYPDANTVFPKSMVVDYVRVFQ